jgi:hypothetical protein
MATVKAPLGALHRINLDVNGEPTSPGIVIANTDSIEFYNGAPFSVEIQFLCVNGPVFSDIPSIAHNQTSSPQTPQETEITTDYMVKNLSTGATSEPYSIEVGINPLVVPAPLQINVSSAQASPNSGDLAIPINGWIQFDLQDGSYTISWTPVGVFPSGTYGPGMVVAWQAQTGNQDQDASFTLSGPKDATGGGTVKIRS